jgi:carboxypeptidase Taq
VPYDFHIPAGTETAYPAYDTLERLFGAVQADLNRYETLKAAKWVAPAEKLDAITAEIVALRRGIHARLTGPPHDAAALLRRAEGERGRLPPWQRANLDLMKRIHAQVSAADPAMIAELEDVMARTEPEWLATRDEFERLEEERRDLTRAGYRARKNEIYARQLALFRENFAARSRAARRRDMTPSQAMLDFWNPYEDNAALESLLAQAERALPGLIAAAHRRHAGIRPPLPLPPVAPRRQARFVDTLLAAYREATGLTEDEQAARGVTLVHTRHFPGSFCWGHPRHMHLSVQLYRDRMLDGFLNAHHELGHFSYLAALSALPADLAAQPVGQINGYGIHEVAAMFFEMAAGRAEYFALAAPAVREAAGAAADDPRFSAANLYLAANYPASADLAAWGGSDLAHLPQMAWRIRAERLILDGGMDIADLAAFRARTLSRFTGMEESRFSDVSGIFDTSHWAGEEYGYFPAYVFGALGAAMLHEKIRRERGREIAAARTLPEYLAIHHAFMEEHIYRHASLYRPRELMERALGAPLAMDAYLRHLSRPLAFREARRRPHPG